MQRLRRIHYLLFSVIIGIIQFIIYDYVQKSNLSEDDIYTYLFISLAVLVFGLYFTAIRLHDINYSGWWSLLLLVPVINIAGIALFFIDGTVGSNKYGEDPKKRIKKDELIETVHSTTNTQQTINNNSDNKLNKLIEKSQLLEESLKIGIINKEEYEAKKKEIINNKEGIKKRQSLESQRNLLKQEFTQQKVKLNALLNEGLLNQIEYDKKVKEIIDNLPRVKKESANINTKYYYKSVVREYGPYSIYEIIKRGLDMNYKIRPESEPNYNSGLIIDDFFLEQ